MKKVLLAVSLCLLTSSLLSQSIPLRQINFNDARISLAGPEAFYIRNVGFEGDRYSVLLGPAEGGGWTVTNIYSESENLTPREMILDFATIRLEGANTLVLDGIFVDGAVYQGRLRVGEDNEAELLGRLETSSLEALDPARLRKLRETILKTVAPEYEERITALQGELRTAREQINQQETIIDELLAENGALEDELARRESEISSLKERISSLESELGRAANGGPSAGRAGSDGVDRGIDVSRLDLARLEREISALREEATGVASFLRELQAENEELVRENERLRTALEATRGVSGPSAAGGAPSASSWEVATATDLLARYERRLSRTLLQGFERGRARMGAWRIEPSLAVQTDPGEYFSRFALPLEQLDQPTIFSFRGRSLETTEWTGFGLHLFASGVEHPNGYGHGESLLIWFTRDREHYGTDHTYLQIYRSSDDVTMDRVAGGIIPEPITSPLDVSVLYQPEVGDVTIAVNGEVKLLYNGWFGIDRGMEIALRTKGRGRFEELRVITSP